MPLPRVCTPNTRTCTCTCNGNGNTLQACNSLGTAFTPTPCTGGFCPTQGCVVIR